MHNTLSRRLIAITLGTFAAAAVPALAQDHAGHGQSHMQHGAAAMPAMPAMTDAEVRRIDKDAGKITLRHGEIKHLDMPPMTMVFTVRDKALLDKTSVGAKVRIQVVSENGQMVVTELQPAP